MGSASPLAVRAGSETTRELSHRLRNTCASEGGATTAGAEDPPLTSRSFALGRGLDVSLEGCGVVGRSDVEGDTNRVGIGFGVGEAVARAGLVGIAEKDEFFRRHGDFVADDVAFAVPVLGACVIFGVAVNDHHVVVTKCGFVFCGGILGEVVTRERGALEVLCKRERAFALAGIAAAGAFPRAENGVANRLRDFCAAFARANAVEHSTSAITIERCMLSSSMRFI